MGPLCQEICLSREGGIINKIIEVFSLYDWVHLARIGEKMNQLITCPWIKRMLNSAKETANVQDQNYQLEFRKKERKKDKMKERKKEAVF